YTRADFRATPDGRHLTEDHTRTEPFPDIEANRDQYEILGWELQPGDCVMFHGMTVHGGSGKLPEKIKRHTVSLQWFGDDIVFSPKAGGVDPDFLGDFRNAGMSPGMPIVSEVCPLVWPR
ncbi:MAG: phytanoyl-CoA dioxygenase family protein, partial [bacterium]